MHSDAYFTGCKAHNVCQDYARAGKTPLGRVYAVVSDGCSSSPDTDFGSRFLTMAAVQSIDRLKDVDQNVIWRATPPPALMSPYCLDATLIAAFEQQQEDYDYIAIRGFGDGVVVYKDELHTTVQVYSHPSGAPAYLSYLLDPSRLKFYLSEGHGKREIEEWKDGNKQQLREDSVRMEDNKPAGFQWEFNVSRDSKHALDLVMIMTDGVHSFHRKDDGSPVPFLEVVKHMLDIKTFAGEFMSRRAKRFFQNTCAEMGWVNNDDFGVAAIHLGE